MQPAQTQENGQYTSGEAADGLGVALGVYYEVVRELAKSDMPTEELKERMQNGLRYLDEIHRKQSDKTFFFVYNIVAPIVAGAFIYANFPSFSLQNSAIVLGIAGVLAASAVAEQDETVVNRLFEASQFTDKILRERAEREKGSGEIVR